MEVLEISLLPKYPELHSKKVRKAFMFGDKIYVWTHTKLRIYCVVDAKNTRKPPAMSVFAAIPQSRLERVDTMHIAIPSDDFWVFGPWYKQGDYVVNSETGITEKIMGAVKHATDTQIVFRIVNRIHDVNGACTTPQGTIKFDKGDVISSKGIIVRDCKAFRVYEYEGAVFIWCQTENSKYEDSWDVCVHNTDGRFLHHIYKDYIYDVHGMWARDASGWFTVFNKRSNYKSGEPVWWANDVTIECFPS